MNDMNNTSVDELLINTFLNHPAFVGATGVAGSSIGSVEKGIELHIAAIDAGNVQYSGSSLLIVPELDANGTPKLTVKINAVITHA